MPKNITTVWTGCQFAAFRGLECPRVCEGHRGVYGCWWLCPFPSSLDRPLQGYPKAKQLQEALEGLLDYAETHPKTMRSFYDQTLAGDGWMSYDEFLNFAREMLAAATYIVEEQR
jgi:hypothetical protein